MKIRSRALVALATTATVLLGGVSPAQAATSTRTDAFADVVRFTDPESGEYVAAPGVNQGDIRRMVVAHRDTDVAIRVHFNELVRGQQVHFLGVAVLTPELRRQLQIIVHPDSTGQGEVTWMDRRGVDRACAGLSTRVDWGRNVLRVTVPRSCLSAPTWVRSGAFYVRATPRNKVFADESHRNGQISDGSVQLGGRVHRG